MRTVKVAGFAPTPQSSLLASSESGHSNASFRNYPTITTGQVVLLTAQESLAALEFMEFQAQVANLIFSKWIARPDPEHNDSTFTGYAF